jgi:hypothetical protein
LQPPGQRAEPAATTGYLGAYRTHPGRDPYAETQLREAGLIHGDADHGEPVYASDDVLFSLRRTGPRHTPRWGQAQRRRIAATAAIPPPDTPPPPTPKAVEPGDTGRGWTGGHDDVDLTAYDRPSPADD